MAVVESPISVAPILTEEQQAALQTREISVGMSAGAGCGKTFVLTQRFLSHLDPTSPYADDAASRLEQLIAITFTDRAAREMRQRIRAECRRRLLTCADEYADFWLQLLRSLEAARISTIHSFCGSLLRAHAVEAGLDPHFTILEPLQANTILAGLIADELRGRLNTQDNDVIDLASLYGLGSLSSFVFRFLEQRHVIDWSRWQKVAPEELIQIWQHHFQQRVMPEQISQFVNSLVVQECFGLLDQYEPGHDVMAQRCDRVKEILELTIDTQPLQALGELLEVAKVQGGGGKTVWPSEEIYAEVRDTFTELRKRAEKLVEKLSFDPAYSRVTAELGLKLLNIAASIHHVYEQRKTDLVCLDFDDLLIRAHRLLANPQHEDLRQRLARNIQLLMIDEFQDTDPIQAELVQFFCGSELANGKLFFVGDHKQSIYRFRGADPNVFSDLRSKLPREACLSLGLNFRSQPAILHFVNYLFYQPLSTPEAYQPLRAFHPQVNEQPCIEFLWACEEDESDEKPNAETLRRWEAKWMARRIRQMLDTKENLVRAAENQTLRSVELGDIAILFQALSDLQHYENALREYDIPYYLVGGHAFYAQQEVFDLLNLLRAIAKPTDGISLVGALRSPFFGIADETLFWLQQNSNSLHQALLSEDSPEQLDPQQLQRWKFAQRTLRALREKKDRISIASLLREVMDRTSYDAGLLADFLGDRKYGNLQKLMEMARSFDRSGLFTLDDYITQLSEFVAKQPKEPPAATEPEDSNVVRLMSIHQAKGLEFPGVFVPDLQRKKQISNEAVAFSPTLGPLIQPPTDDEIESRSCGLALHRLEEQAAADAEMDRLFYVATTRAADYLVLSAGVDALDKVQGPWMNLLAEHFDLPTGTVTQAGVDADLAQKLGPSQYSSPKVRVVAECPTLEEEPRSRKRGPSLSKILKHAENDPAQSTPKFVPKVEPNIFPNQLYTLDRATGNLELREVAALDPLEEAFHSSFGFADPQAQQQRLDALIYAIWQLWDWNQPQQLPSLVQQQTSKYHLPGMEPFDSGRVLTLFEQFTQSNRFAELTEAKETYRGIEYLFPTDYPGQGALTIQGVIDCLYQTASSGWVLIQFQIRPEVKSAKELAFSLRLAEQAAQSYTKEDKITALVYDLWTGEEFFPSSQNSLARLLPRALETANAKYLKTSPRQSKPALKQRSLWD